MPFQTGNPGRPPRDPRERFWKYVDMNAPVGYPTGCWLWTGGKSWDGYGRFRVTDRTVRAHRYSWQLVYGELSAGLTLDHLCRNRQCVNPAHLEPVTLQENNRRGLRRGHGRTTPYKRPKAA